MKKELIKTFDEYLKNFDLKDKDILRKYNHSIRVMSLCENIAKDEKLSKDDINLSIVSGLVHDIGRFTQWTTYHSYNDLLTIDHGDLGEELLKNSLIKKFWYKKEDYSSILKSVKYHNKRDLNAKFTPRELLITKVVRDADKIDILHLYLTVELEFNENSEISEAAKNDFLGRKLVNHKNVKTDADIVLRTLAFVFDLNFDYSFSYLKENKTIERLFDLIKDKKKYAFYFDYVKNYIDDKLNI